jgi:hypothetical protein
MLKKMFVVFMAALFAFTIANSVTAATRSAYTYTKMLGTVTKVDSMAHNITLQAGNDTKTIHFTSSTVFLNKGKKVKATSLKENEKVTVYLDSKEDAHKIEISAASSQAKSR